MAIEIETSTDTPEQVRAALGTSIEIEESQDEEEKPVVEKPVKAAVKKPVKAEEPPSEDESEEDDDEDDEPEEVTEEAGGKPQKKPVPMVPQARLSEEIRKRKAAESRLAARSETPVKEDPESVAAERPQFFSGKPIPTIEDFTKDIDEFDPKKMAKAMADFTKAYSNWAREEGRAEAAYDNQVAAAQERLAEIRGDYEERRAAFQEVEPLYDEIVPTSQVMLSDQQRDFIWESEVGPQLILYFAQNPREADKMRRLRGRSQGIALQALESEIMEEYGIEPEAEAKPTVKPKVEKVVPPLKKPETKQAPEPPTRIKSAGPGPRSERDLAGTEDRTGVDIEFNKDYEKAVAARKKI